MTDHKYFIPPGCQIYQLFSLFDIKAERFFQEYMLVIQQGGFGHFIMKIHMGADIYSIKIF